MRADDEPGAAPALAGEGLPTLPARRVKLRWLEERDVDDLFAVFSDPAVTRFWAWTAYRERDQAARLLAQIQARFRRGDLYQWGVARLDDDRVIGTCTLSSIDRDNGRAEIGFALAQAHWGHGYMVEATTTLLPFAFGPLGLRRVEADVDPRNAPSIRLLERLGFRREGLLRERWRVGGEVQDALMMGLLAREWTGT